MKVRIMHSDTEGQDRISRYARELLCRTLESYRPQIRSVTIKVGFGTGVPLGEFDYHCTVLIYMTQGTKIKTEARDCDEILSIYQAVDKARNMMEHQEDKLSPREGRRQ